MKPALTSEFVFRHPEASLSARAALIKGSPIDSSISLLQRQTRPVISFAMGCPASDAIPLDELRSITVDVLERGGADALNYGPTEGERSLRDALLSFVPEICDEKIRPEELLVTSGGMQGIDLTCKLFVDPGDLVIVEEPLYSNSAMVIRSYEGDLLPVPVDQNGMMVELIPDLVNALGRIPKLINVIPNFQNPSGATLSLDRRRLLLRLADQYQCVILEDDPYRLLHFDCPCPPSLRALSGNNPAVIAVHTFSKVLSPGLRVGWVMAAPDVISKMIDARQGMDTCSNVLGQRVIAEFCSRGLLARHVEQLRQIYAARFDALVEALKRTFGDNEDVVWTQPGGGFFLWITLPAWVDSERLFPIALEQGVAFVPGAAFSNRSQFRNAARLCFAFPKASDMRGGVEKLRTAMDLLKCREQIP